MKITHKTLHHTADPGCDQGNRKQNVSPAPPDWSNKVFFDNVHFPQSLERFPWRGKGIYLIRGKVVLDMGFPSVEVDWMDKLAWRTG